MSDNNQTGEENTKTVNISLIDSNAVTTTQDSAANNNAIGAAVTNNLSASVEAEVLQLLTEVDEINDSHLRQKNTELLGYLGKLLELLKEKSNECVTLEKQNAALVQQSKSLKEVVAIVKDLLSIRNMELSHLQQDISSMQDKINNERSRQNSMIEKMDHVAKLNKSLKEEYLKQYTNFQNVRTMYEEKVAILTTENKRLQELTNGNETNTETMDQLVRERLNNITLELQAFPPFDDTINENVEK